MVRRILLLLLPSRMQIQIPLMQMGSSRTRLFSCAVQELHFLGQETLVSSFPAWSVSPTDPRELSTGWVYSRVGIQRENLLKLIMLTELWIENVGSSSEILGPQPHFQSNGEECLCYFQQSGNTELWSKPRTICPTEGRMCFHCSSVVMNRVTTDENMRKISTLLVKSYNDFEQLSCTDQLERRRTNICSCGPESSQKYFKEQQS